MFLSGKHVYRSLLLASKSRAYLALLTNLMQCCKRPVSDKHSSLSPLSPGDKVLNNTMVNYHSTYLFYGLKYHCKLLWYLIPRYLLYCRCVLCNKTTVIYCHPMVTTMAILFHWLLGPIQNLLRILVIS